MIRVLIVDDHRMVRAGFRRILEDETEIGVVGEASNGQEALEFVNSHPVDVALLDISMPGENGLKVLPKLKHASPELIVLMVSMHGEARVAARARDAGADAYMTKESAADDLIKAIKELYAAKFSQT